jgi:hypothetical protein
MPWIQRLFAVQVNMTVVWSWLQIHHTTSSNHQYTVTCVYVTHLSNNLKELAVENADSGAHIRTGREFYFWNTWHEIHYLLTKRITTQIYSTDRHNNETNCDRQLTDQQVGAHKIFLIIDETRDFILCSALV